MQKGFGASLPTVGEVGNLRDFYRTPLIEHLRGLLLANPWYFRPDVITRIQAMKPVVGADGQFAFSFAASNGSPIAGASSSVGPTLESNGVNHDSVSPSAPTLFDSPKILERDYKISKHIRKFALSPNPMRPYLAIATFDGVAILDLSRGVWMRVLEFSPLVGGLEFGSDGKSLIIKFSQGDSLHYRITENNPPSSLYKDITPIIQKSNDDYLAAPKPSSEFPNRILPHPWMQDQQELRTNRDHPLKSIWKINTSKVDPAIIVDSTFNFERYSVTVRQDGFIRVQQTAMIEAFHGREILQMLLFGIFYRTEYPQEDLERFLSGLGRVKAIFEKKARDMEEFLGQQLATHPGLEDLVTEVDNYLGIRDQVGEVIEKVKAHTTRPSIIHYLTAVAGLINPVLGTVKEISDLLLELNRFKLLRVDTDRLNIDLRRFVAQHFVLPPQVEFSAEVYSTGNFGSAADVAFVQTIQRNGKTSHVLRVTKQTLEKIYNSAKSLSERAAAKGVYLSSEEAKKLAVETFFLHEVGHSVFGLSDGELLKAGLADEARVGALKPDPLPFFTIDDMLGGLQSMVGPDQKAVFKNKKLANGSASWAPEVIRKRMLDLIQFISKVTPLLHGLLPKVKTYNYRFSAQDDDKTAVYNQSHMVSPTGLLGTLDLEVEHSRIQLFSGPEAPKQLAPTEQVYEIAGITLDQIEALAVFDQMGGFKDLVDQYLKYLSDPARMARGPFVAGVLQLEKDFVQGLSAYIEFLEKRDPSNVDLAKAKIFRSDLSKADGPLQLIYLTQALTQSLVKAADGTWDVSSTIDFFRTQAQLRRPGVTIQKVVFISDWRKLVVSQILSDITIRMIYNLNVFMSIEDKIKVETFAAISA
jgi:hypothetical protein